MLSGGRWGSVEQAIDITATIRDHNTEPEPEPEKPGPEPEPEQQLDSAQTVILVAVVIAAGGTLLLAVIVACSRSKTADEPRRSSVNSTDTPAI